MIGIVRRWMLTTSPKRGDVVLVLFPDSNLRTAKRRPVLVVQNTSLDSGLPQTIVAMISSNLARAGHPSRVSLPMASPLGTSAGVRTDSVIMTDNLATIRNDEIDRQIGSIVDMSPVDAALLDTLGFR
jgi:mRNA interferase MazF